VRLAIFRVGLDFYTDPRPGILSAWFLKRKFMARMKSVAYGRIFAAEYDNEGRPYKAVLFRDSAGRPAYYSADGKSLQKAFLRSAAKICCPRTSHYNRHRFHPVLNIIGLTWARTMPLPIGTAGAAVAHGRVVSAGRQRRRRHHGSIETPNAYETYYLHLSRPLVRTGQVVQQGQTIGLVGATGLATGRISISACAVLEAL